MRQHKLFDVTSDTCSLHSTILNLNIPPNQIIRQTINNQKYVEQWVRMDTRTSCNRLGLILLPEVECSPWSESNNLEISQYPRRYPCIFNPDEVKCTYTSWFLKGMSLSRLFMSVHRIWQDMNAMTVVVAWWLGWLNIHLLIQMRSDFSMKPLICQAQQS